jgi:hypothetical protein
MAEWPVRIIGYPETLFGKPEPILPGEEVRVKRYRIGSDDGEAEFGGLNVTCPRCGGWGGCPAGKWTFDPSDPQPGDTLTMNPSIVCDCGGHFWLTDGVLREV